MPLKKFSSKENIINLIVPFHYIPHGIRFWNGHPTMEQFLSKPSAYWNYPIRLLRYKGFKEIKPEIKIKMISNATQKREIKKNYQSKHCRND